jgi:hypothetical protein
MAGGAGRRGSALGDDDGAEESRGVEQGARR